MSCSTLWWMIKITEWTEKSWGLFFCSLRNLSFSDGMEDRLHPLNENLWLWIANIHVQNSIAFKLSPLTTHHCDGPQPLANLATTWEKKTPYGTNNLTITCQKLDYNFIWWSTLSNTNLFLWANAWACVNLLSKSRLQKFLATNWCRNLRLTLATIFLSLS